MKNSNKYGFTIFESMIALTIGATAAVGVLSNITKETEANLVKNFVDQSYDIVKAVDHRIAIDGYDPDLWTKREWNNEAEVVENLIGKHLVSKYLNNCSGGEWEPVPSSEYETKLIGCEHWKERKNNGENISAELIVDNVGFIQGFNLFVKYNNPKDFKDRFLNTKKAMLKTEININQELTGSHYIDFISWASKNDINSSQCLQDLTDCAIKFSIDRNGGNEYLRADGGNSMIGEHLTFVETKGQAPMKCVRWKNTLRDGTGAWNIEPVEDCGIGIYRNDPHPVMVDVVADTGTFKSVVLDKECNVYAWNSTTKTVVDTGNTSPCGTMSNAANEVVQVVENIQSENAEIFNLKATNATIQNIAITNIVADNIVSKFVTIENKLKVDIIESYNNSKIELNNDLLSNENFTIKKLLTAEYVNINNHLNANSGTINSFYSTSITGTDATINNNLKVKNKLIVDGDTSLGIIKTSGNATFKSTSKFENNATFDKRIVSNDYLQFNKVSRENGWCSPNGLLSRTSSGEVLSCVNGRWSKASSSPSVRQVYGSSVARRWPSKTVRCHSSEVVVGGGVQCDSKAGYLRMPANRPNGNGWYGRCDTDKNQNVRVHVYAICLKK